MLSAAVLIFLTVIPGSMVSSVRNTSLPYISVTFAMTVPPSLPEYHLFKYNFSCPVIPETNNIQTGRQT
jgi:hypothetical protein